MKPLHAARRRDYVFVRISHAEAAMFIKEHHYARGCSNTSVWAFGLLRGPVLVAAMLWMPPTRAAAETVSRDGWRRVLSLSRLAVLPGEPTNTASLFLGCAIRHLRAEGRWNWLVTYADESQGHKGTIYRATNWRYVGETKPEARWVGPSGEQVSRLATRSRTAAQMRELGYSLAGRYTKHEFVFDLRAGGAP